MSMHTLHTRIHNQEVRIKPITCNVVWFRKQNNYYTKHFKINNKPRKIYFEKNINSSN